MEIRIEGEKISDSALILCLIAAIMAIVDILLGIFVVTVCILSERKTRKDRKRKLEERLNSQALEARQRELERRKEEERRNGPLKHISTQSEKYPIGGTRRYFVTKKGIVAEPEIELGPDLSKSQSIRGEKSEVRKPKERPKVSQTDRTSTKGIKEAPPKKEPNDIKNDAK